MIRIEIEHLWAQRKIHEDLITQLEDFARAIIAARDEELRKQEPVAWMIECSNAFVGWWNDTTKLDCRYFDADPNKGRRFNTKEEAEELIQSKGNSCMKATGHLWVNEGTLKDGMKLSAAPIPPVTPSQRESGWLIEIKNPAAPFWLCIDGSFTNDANRALRFCRKSDAEGFIKVIEANKFGNDVVGLYKKHLQVQPMFATEHIFLAAPIPPTVTPSQQEALRICEGFRVLAGQTNDADKLKHFILARPDEVTK